MSTPPVDLDCDVFPLLHAITWIGQASHKLTEIHHISGAVPEVKRFVGGIADPDTLHAGELLSELAWIATNLLHRFQEEEQKVAQHATPGGEA